MRFVRYSAMPERRDTSPPGQALEFEICSDLIKQSQGALHVFLPLLDRSEAGILNLRPDGPELSEGTRSRIQPESQKRGRGAAHREPPPLANRFQALLPAVSAGTTPSCWSRPNMS